MFHCNLEFLRMTDGRIFLTHQSPNIVAGPICLYLLLHQLTRMSKFLLHTHMYSPPIQEKLSKSNPSTHDKRKDDATSSSPSSDSAKSISSRMHLRDDCSHVISEINPKDSTHTKDNSRSSKGDNNNKGKITSQSGKYSFWGYLLLIFLEQLFAEVFGQHIIFGYFGYYYVWIWFKISLIFKNFKLWEWLWEPQGGMCLIGWLVMFILLRN